MREIEFQKMVASGNDFVVIDNRERAIRDVRAFARSVCPAHTGIGADGVLLIESSHRADFKMRIINADGSEAEACGNGFRCLGLYAHEKLHFPASMTVETPSGEIEISVRKDVIRVKMIDPQGYKDKITLSGIGPNRRALTCAFIDTGVPHAVVFTEHVDRVDVSSIGRAIRNHAAFRPRGTNADFVEITGQNSISVRTYERGVEGETLACGTGSVASAAVAVLMGQLKSPVRVLTRSGETLVVDLLTQGRQVVRVFLEGRAKYVFEGRLYSWNSHART